MNKVIKILLISLFTLNTCANSNNINHGIQILSLFPLGPLSTVSKTGSEFGIFIKNDLNKGHKLTTRLATGQLGKRNIDDLASNYLIDFDYYSIKYTTSTINLDYSYHLSRRMNGYYIILGIDLQRLHKSLVKTPTIFTNFVRENINSIRLGGNFGIGRIIDKNISYELKISNHRFNNSSNPLTKRNFLTTTAGIVYTL